MSQRLIFACVLILLIIFADQLSKWWVMENFLSQDGSNLNFAEWLQLNARLPFNMVEIFPFFNLVMVWNEGISFGLFNNGADLALIISLVSLSITAGLSVWIYQTNSTFKSIALALIVGGALGNIIDRLRYGAVADFIDIHIAGYHWPAFNLADSAITIGVALLLIHNIFLEEETK